MKMKNMMKSLTGVFLVSLLLLSCKKDDTTETKNYLKIDGIEYNLSAGSLRNYGNSNGYEGYNTDLHLYSKGVTYKDGSYSGKGHIICFYMSSTNGDELDIAEYALSSKKPYPIGTFNYGYYQINMDFEDEDCDFDSDIEDGIVSVSIKGSEYTITINCINEDGERVRGFYRGKLDYSVI